MLNLQETADDYVMATSKTISVKEFAEKAFFEAGYTELEWVGEGAEEKLYDATTKRVLLEIDPQFYRAGEVPYLRGCHDKITKALGWTPKIKWEDLLKEML